MSGLLLLATVALWLVVCVWLARKLGRLVPAPGWRLATTGLLLLALLAAPFIDEVIGKQQFQALCRAHGIESTDVSKAHGKKVKVEYGERTVVSETILPMKESDVLFRDADSGEVLIRHKNYYASGGWLMRYTWLGMGSGGPMLFTGNGCGLMSQDRLFNATQILIVN